MMLTFNQYRLITGLEPLGGQSNHMTFMGNPGTGKTVAARLVAELLANLGVVQRPSEEEIMMSMGAALVGDTALQVKARVMSALGGVLFIDEAYALVQSDK